MEGQESVAPKRSHAKRLHDLENQVAFLTIMQGRIIQAIRKRGVQLRELGIEEPRIITPDQG